ncbi:hypothetical protein TIFTF001_020218 [Ficus carica]|uniref:Uncharacterized protein n=1 Tax=Ficus carica TaxID=3494 RepID=A0AA88AD81_FICCA|nr:hypothetical protein TIFTF001_020218 [Ficus carica]
MEKSEGGSGDESVFVRSEDERERGRLVVVLVAAFFLVGAAVGRRPPLPGGPLGPHLLPAQYSHPFFPRLQALQEFQQILQAKLSQGDA